MAVFSIKDPINDIQARVVNIAGGALQVYVVNPAGGGGGWTSFGQGTPDQITVTNTSTSLLDANPNRLFARIVNNSTQTIYMQYSIAAVWQQGVPIRPNSVYIIGTDELYLGAINAITDTGSVEIDVTEGVS